MNEYTELDFTDINPFTDASKIAISPCSAMANKEDTKLSSMTMIFEKGGLYTKGGLFRKITIMRIKFYSRTQFVQ